MGGTAHINSRLNSKLSCGLTRAAASDWQPEAVYAKRVPAKMISSPGCS